MRINKFSSLFKARSVTFVGASNDPAKWGFLTLKHIIDGGYRGTIYPVNPKEPEILGLKVYRNIADLPETPDLAVIIVPPPAVPAVIKECVSKGIKAGIIITAGFAELGGEGSKLQNQIVEITRSGGMALVGPNCNGVMSPWNTQYIQFPSFFVPPGPVAVIAQSGNVMDSLARQIQMHGFGCSVCIASGNEAVLHCEDYLEYLADDPRTKVILSYIELDKILPAWWNRGNPVDLVAGAAGDNLFKAVELVMQCPSVDALMFLSIMPALRAGSFDAPRGEVARKKWGKRLIESVALCLDEFNAMADKYNKPIIIASEHMWADNYEQAGITFTLGQHNAVCYRMPGDAARVLDALVKYGEYVR